MESTEMDIMETVEYYNALKNLICCCAFDMQQFFLFKDFMGDPVSSGVSLRNWFIYIAAGKGYAVVDRMKYPLNRGSLVFLYPGVEFSISHEKEEALTYYAIGFIHKNAFCKEERDTKNNNCPGSYIKLTNVIKVEKLLEGMYRYSLNGNLNENPELKCNFYNLMLSFLEDIKSGLNNMAIYKRIEKATDFIYENYNKKICIGDLAKRCNISKEYFIRVFKDYTGSSPGRFIINVRINKAKELLLMETYKIKEVAFLVGFDDEVYFSKLFKKIVGVSPRYYMAKSIY